MLFLTGVFGLIKLIAAVAFMTLFVKVKGNRFWLHLGSSVCAVSMFVLAICIWSMSTESGNNQAGSVSVQGIVSVLCVYIFSFFFGVSLGPISWNVCGEVFPARMSAKCCTITTFTQWLFQIVIASITPRLIANIGWGTYVVYGLCCTISLGWCWMMVPETRGVALGREMDRLFENKDDSCSVDDATEDEAAEQEDEEEAAMVEVSETSPLLFASRKRHRRSSVALIV